MSIEEAVFVPAFGYDEGNDPTLFAKFDPCWLQPGRIRFGHFPGNP